MGYRIRETVLVIVSMNIYPYLSMGHVIQMVAEDQREQLYQRLLRDLARRPLPERRNRVNPRVVKQKMSNFLRKRQKHYQGLQPLELLAF